MRLSSRTWRTTEQGIAAYRVTRDEAQERANMTGFDHGIEANDSFKSWRSFQLPRRENRRGHETHCEVVMCENLDKCQKGHGPR